MLTNHWIWRVIAALLFHCFRVLWNLKEKLFNPEEKEGARIYDIAFRHHLDKVLMPSSLKYFCLKFKKTAPLSAILDDNVYLYTYDSTEAAFIVVEPGKEIWRSKHGSFYKQAQNDHAKQMIVTSLKDFFAVCDKLPNPGSKLNFVHSTPRSGSTLLIQMFEETGQCIAVCEPEEFIPDPLINLKPGITHDEKLQLFGSIGKYVSRAVNGHYNWYFAKVIANGSLHYYDILREIFPESKHIFLYRDFKPTMKSFLNTMHNFPMSKCMTALAKFFPSISEEMKKRAIRLNDTHVSPTTQERFGQLWDQCKPDGINPMIGMFHYCCPYDFFLNKHELPAMKYEDILENRYENTKKIFEYFGLPLNLVCNGLKAMERDSQRNSAIAKKKIGTESGDVDLGDRVQWLAGEFCQMFNVPKFDGEQRHKCTITVPASG